MKELIIYDNYQNNLCSIKSIKDNYSDKIYMKNIVKKLSDLTTGFFHIDASRPTYEYNVTELAILIKNVLNDADSLKYNDFGVLLSKHKIDSDLLELLPMIWFSYQHAAFCFFEEEIKLDVNRKAWYDITKNSKSYVMFKGAEEDVIWIGKSQEFNFDFLKMD
jgi:hypothetical protein